MPDTDTDTDTYAVDAANSAANELERARRAERAWEEKARKLIMADAGFAKKFAAQKGYSYEEAKNEEWFLEHLAEELSVYATITNALNFAAGNDEHSFAADGVCDACGEPVDGLGCVLAGGAKAKATERLDEALEQIENDDFVKFSQPPALDVQHMDDIEPAPDLDEPSADEEKRPIILEIVGKPEDILAASDPQAARLGELAREVVELREKLRIQTGYAQEYRDNSNTWRRKYDEQMSTVTGLTRERDELKSMLTSLGNELEEWRRQDRRNRKTIAALRAHLNNAATHITRHAPRQPSAKRTGFIKLAEMLTSVAEAETLKKAVTTTPKAKKPKATPKKKR